ARRLGSFRLLLLLPLLAGVSRCPHVARLGIKPRRPASFIALSRRAGPGRARLRRSGRQLQDIGGERRRAFAAVGVVLAQEACETALALSLAETLRTLVAAGSGAVA